MIGRQSVKGFYYGYGNAILFQDKLDAQYFVMQATFIKSREPEKNPKPYSIVYNLPIRNPYPILFDTTSV